MTTPQAFDPSRFLTLVSGKEYLEVKWRLVWLRSEHPDAVIDTELVHLKDNWAMFKATVSIPNGGSATGYGSEDTQGFKDFIEKAECVPLTVPILTRWGWRHYHQLCVGQDVLAYNPATGQTEWTPLLDVTTFPKAPLVQIGNSRFSAVCTPDHKWVLNDRLTPWNQHRAGHTITLAAPIDVTGGNPDGAARLGWLMTDCRLSYAGGLPSSAEVQQSKPENFPELDRLFGSHTREVQHADREWGAGHVSSVLAQRVWAIPAAEVRRMLGQFGVSTRDDLPAAVLRMTRDEAAAFLDAAMAADGSMGTSPTFGKTSRPVVEAVQLAAFLTGRTSGVIAERAGNAMTTKPCYTVGIHKAGHKYVSEFRTTPIPPQDVWCPTTAFGTWVANFNGFIGITGNTKAIGRALAALGFGTQFTGDFDFGAAAGRVVDAPTQMPQRAPQRDSGEPRPIQAGPGGATEKQIGAIRSMARKLGMSGDPADLNAMTRQEASKMIEDMQAQLTSPAPEAMA